MQHDDVTANPIWRTATILKIVFKYVSTVYYPRVLSNGKFCKKEKNHPQTQVAWPKWQVSNFKMADGRHFENGFISMSAGNHPISMKFGVQTQILVPTTWQISKFCKFKMAVGCHIENRFFFVSQRFISDLREIWYGKAESRSETGHVTKIPNVDRYISAGIIWFQ